MITLKEYVLRNDHVLDESFIWEMARVKPIDSGVNVIMFMSTRESVKGRHWARIKVSNVIGTFSSTDNFVLSIDDSPVVLAGTPTIKSSVLTDIKDWVILNKVTLLKYWNDEFDSDSEFYNQLKKV